MHPDFHVVVLTGAGISAESGISTFRDADGLWENHPIEDVATPQGWRRNPELVLEFYNQRRRQLKTVAPNAAHHALKALEQHCKVTIITQNVDDLHERAGSSKVLHLHGELRKARSTGAPGLVYDWDDDLHLGQLCERGHQLRPHIVWFGEDVPAIPVAAQIMATADAVFIVGTSMQVYPAAGLVAYAAKRARIFYIDPKPAIDNYELNQLGGRLEIIAATATVGVPRAIGQLLDNTSGE